MTTIDPFTTPAEAERAARAKQAQYLLAWAADSRNFCTPYTDDQKVLYDKDAATAMYAAQAAAAHAMLAVRDELADIAGSLRTLAAMPTAMQNVADHVSALDDTIGGGLAELTEAVHKHGLGLSDDQCAIVEALRAHGEVVDSAVFGVADVMDRPRWWQLRRRWTLWRSADGGKRGWGRFARQTAALLDDAEASMLATLQRDAGRTPEEPTGEVYEFLVEVRRQEPCTTTSYEVLGRVRFHAEYEAACDTAGTMLPGLCAQLGVPADPDQVHGRVSRCDTDGGEDCYIGLVFLDGATVLTSNVLEES
jgi:hypothetical protein